jgi:hypothetical protein
MANGNADTVPQASAALAVREILGRCRDLLRILAPPHELRFRSFVPSRRQWGESTALDPQREEQPSVCEIVGDETPAPVDQMRSDGANLPLLIALISERSQLHLVVLRHPASVGMTDE